ncbi:MAG: RimK family protein [bacterium]|jgi:glutathione synthase/RimK-type ligase-like ATP-grasp enzyme
MSAQIVIVEQRGDWKEHYPDAIVVLAKDYVSLQEYFKMRDLRVVNLCRSYRYHSLGYYCSLLAEARRHRVIPSVRTITELMSKSIYGLSIDDLHGIVEKRIGDIKDQPSGPAFSIYVHFGKCDNDDFQDLSRQLFDLFACPILKVEFRLNGKWQISTIRATSLHGIPEDQEAPFIDGFNAHSSKRWRTPRAKRVSRYDMAILHDPDEKLPPSDPRALQKFIKAGKKLGVDVDLITKKDFSRLGEYDALFIRETTQMEHHTYRFARKAENEGMVVIDDPDSIMKCTNKIYLAELLAANKIPIPRTEILKKDEAADIRSVESRIPYPIVLKIPDSSFSRGVHKVATADDLRTVADGLFSDSDVILAQEYMYTDFDWRIGILNRRPLFACQYFMSRRHWQIMKYDESGEYTEGASKTWKVEDVPEAVVKTALQAANLIGDGFYGVDVKESDAGPVVIEINDNPSIDSGVEDKVLGDNLYQAVIEEFTRRLDIMISI